MIELDVCRTSYLSIYFSHHSFLKMARKCNQNASQQILPCGISTWYDRNLLFRWMLRYVGVICRMPGRWTLSILRTICRRSADEFQRLY